MEVEKSADVISIAGVVFTAEDVGILVAYMSLHGTSPTPESQEITALWNKCRAAGYAVAAKTGIQVPT